MKKILVLGAGLVSRPLVRYLLEVPELVVRVATRTVAKAQRLVDGHPRGEALELDVDDQGRLDELIAAADLVTSLLPYTHHIDVARICLKHRRHLVTTSYVSDGMKALDREARDKGVLLLNEIGLDPGIDHMSAMAIIDRIQGAGGRVTSFMSYCGGLPAPEANDNPFGYKFSWSPKGVVMAGRNPGRYLRDGKEVPVPGEKLFGHRWKLDVPGVGSFEAYPNRNSLPYIDLYGLAGVRTMFRGTLRNPGWCETIEAFANLGLLEDATRADLAGLTAANWLRSLVPGSGALLDDVATRLGIETDSVAVRNMAWLGLFDAHPIGIDRGSNLDVLARLMLEKMAYRPGERDMIVLHHEFGTVGADGSERGIQSTLVDYGQPDADSAMARTVSLPAAIAVRLVLLQGIDLVGVQIPTAPQIYRPILAELAELGIRFSEREPHS